jgi:glutamate-1-semialdehyde 2,1-aminomutase
MEIQQRLGEVMADERRRFEEQHRRSKEMAARAQTHLVSGVPMPWMTRWAGSFPLFIERADGGRFVDVDGNEYVDFCLGDTGSMVGHSRTEVTDALIAQSKRGLTSMLPSPDSMVVAENLSSRFGLPKWQFALSATDANRFVLRFARFLTGKPKIVVNDWCYHGTVDETLVVLDEEGRTVSRPGAIGPQVDPALTTRAVPFNDLDALESALRHGDIACVLMEPALTNIGIVLPQPGYLEGVRALTRKYGVLLVIDETHTICASPGGCTAAWGLEPDFVVIGKTIGGGVPVAAYGMSGSVAKALEEKLDRDSIDVGGVGGTLSGSSLAMAVMKATLTSSLLAEHFEHTIPLATSWASGVAGVIDEHELDWSVQQLGCRAEYWFSQAPTNGADAASRVDHELEEYFHLSALNRGILLTPFHNMALMCPAHTTADVDLHTEAFAEAVGRLV